jgi:CRISPR-associated protein Cmr6
MPLRKDLAGFASAEPKNLRTHAGLWIDKMLVADEPSSAVAGPHLRKIVRPPVPDGYQEAFELRRRGYDRLADANACSTFDATAEGRVIVGLGAKGVLEMGITLNHTWGVPFLPGSALKGVAAAAAHRLSGSASWSKRAGWPEAAPKGGPESWTDYDLLFGTTTNEGAVMFHDAWWVPTGAKHVPLELDVMTVHHPDYYQHGRSAPSDFDEPIPVPFLSFDGTFLIALEGPAVWCDAARYWLSEGLRSMGLGAKTSSSYGRFTLEERIPEQRRLRDARRQALQQELKGYVPGRKQGAAAALVSAAKMGVPWDQIRAAFEQVEKSHRAGLVEAAQVQLPELKAEFANLLVVEAPVRVPVPTPTANPDTKEETTRKNVRARWVADPKSENRYFIEIEGEKKPRKGHTVDVEAGVLAKMKATRDWLDVCAVTGAERLQIRDV